MSWSAHGGHVFWWRHHSAQTRNCAKILTFVTNSGKSGNIGRIQSLILTMGSTKNTKIVFVYIIMVQFCQFRPKTSNLIWNCYNLGIGRVYINSWQTPESYFIAFFSHTFLVPSSINLCAYDFWRTSFKHNCQTSSTQHRALWYANRAW